MRTTSRIARLGVRLALLSVLPVAVSAQSVAIFGSAEASGYGEGTGVLGASVSPGRLGWQPYVSATAIMFRFRSSPTDHNTETAFAPSIGMLHAGPEQSVQFGVGYAFLTDDTPSAISAGAPVGTTNSPFVSAQYSYWGNGSKDVELLGSYSTKSQYLWSRASALTRLSETSRLFAGGEIGLQGSFDGPSSHRISFGPRISYRVSPQFRLGGAAGLRIATGDVAPPATGYVRIEFLALPNAR